MITVKVDGLEEFVDKLNKSSFAITKHLKEALRKSTEVTKQNVARNAPVFEATLKKSITSKVTGLTGIVGVGSEAVKYGYVQEYGRKPGKMPPVSALEKWAAAKMGSSDMAFVLARSIAKKGTKPHPFFQPGLEESISDIEKFFESEVSNMLDSL